MLALIAIVGSVVGLIAAYTGIEILHNTTTKDAAFEEAKRLSSGKGIINIGAGPKRILGAKVIAMDPEVLANIDIEADGLPHFIQLDVERDPLPFDDKHFGCAFASHILEHLDDWQFCLEEMMRVADYVVIVLPDPQYFAGWLVLEHKQHFTVDDINQIFQLYPNVVVYY